MKQATYVDLDPRPNSNWPIWLGTDAGQVYLSVEEAEHLMAQLVVALRELDVAKQQPARYLEAA